MSYPQGTILARTATRGDKFDRLEVVGPSPIRKSTVAEEWTGSGGGDQIIVRPIGNDDMNATEIVPSGALFEHYGVEYEPDPEFTHVESARPGRPVRQLTPEEQFRATARLEESERPKTARARTKIGDQ
jgi:hypothetical protein